MKPRTSHDDGAARGDGRGRRLFQAERPVSSQGGRDGRSARDVGTAGRLHEGERRRRRGRGCGAEVTGPVSFADGEAAYQAKKYGDATAIFERYTEQRPKNAWGHYMLGLSAWKSGDLAKAEQAFETGAERSTRNTSRAS